MPDREVGLFRVQQAPWVARGQRLDAQVGQGGVGFDRRHQGRGALGAETGNRHQALDAAITAGNRFDLLIVMSDARIEGDYEMETGREIVQYFADNGLSHHEIEMVLVGGHGPFTWGSSGKKAVYNSIILEEIARMEWLTQQINPTAAPIKASLIDKHWQRKHGEKAYYGQK